MTIHLGHTTSQPAHKRLGGIPRTRIGRQISQLVTRRGEARPNLVLRERTHLRPNLWVARRPSKNLSQ
jgi:hypothetical protein